MFWPNINVAIAALAGTQDCNLTDAYDFRNIIYIPFEAQDFATVDELVEVGAGLSDNCVIEEIGANHSIDVVTEECSQLSC